MHLCSHGEGKKMSLLLKGDWMFDPVLIVITLAILAGIPDEGLGELSTSVMESPGQKQRQFVCTLWLSPYPSSQPFPWVSDTHSHTQISHTYTDATQPWISGESSVLSILQRIRYEMKIALLQGCTSNIQIQKKLLIKGLKVVKSKIKF